MTALGTSTNANSTNIGNNMSVTFASNGTALATWYDGTNIKASYASSPYSSWTALTVSAASGLVSGQRLDTSNTVNLAFYVSGGLDYAPLTLSGSAYSVGTAVSIASVSTGGSSYMGCLMEKDQQSRYWAVATNRTGSTITAYETTTPTTAGWTSNHSISWTSSSWNDFPAGGIVGNYLLLIYPSASSTFNYQRVDVHGTSIGTWSSAVGFTPGGSTVTNGNFFSFRGNSTAGVQVNDSLTGIWARVYNPTTDTWATAVQLSTSSGDAKPTVVAGSDGNLYVFWQAYNGTNNYAILYKKYNVGTSAWDSSATTAVASGANNFAVSGGSANSLIGLVYQTGTATPWTINFTKISLVTARPFTGMLVGGGLSAGIVTGGASSW